MSILSLLNQTVAIEPKSTPNAYGESTYGTSATHRCRLQRVYRMVRNETGENQVSQTVLYLPPTSTPAIDDRATIEGTTYNVTEVARHVDGNGTLHHWRVILGKDA
jgi:hypothetical protein